MGAKILNGFTKFNLVGWYYGWGIRISEAHLSAYFYLNLLGWHAHPLSQKKILRFKNFIYIIKFYYFLKLLDLLAELEKN
jgi:hypothetical protein